MPNIEYGEPTQANDLSSVAGKYKYDYPDGLDLRPDSALHKEIVKKVLERARTSHNYMSRRYDSWTKIDKTLTAFIPLSEDEERSKSKDSTLPVSIVFPYTHAIMESLLSYMVAAFFQQPIFQYEGHGPDDVLGSILLTKAIDLHCSRNKIGLALHTMFRDAFAYGIGVTVPTWKVQHGKRMKKQDVGFMSSLTNSFKKTSSKRVEEDAVLFEGNDLVNIDPYKALLDPNVAAHKVQDGEFFGWVENTNRMALLESERHDKDFFNVKYLRDIRNSRTTITQYDASARELKMGGRPEDKSSVLNPIDVVHMYINIIPKDWKLGESEYPEKWYFQIASDSLLIQAKPIGLNHNMFPVAIIAPDYDGYSTAPIARLEMLYGLQGTLDWLFNTHVSNVRKAINDMFVYDPYLINSKDLENPQEGWLIRTRKPAWGKGVKDAIQQLNVQDVTRQNIADSSWLVQWMEKIGSTDGAMMGSLRQGGPDRLSSAEFQGTKQGAFSRLERMAKIIGLQGMQDLGFFFAMHTQQLAKEDTYVNVLGDWTEVLMKEYKNSIQRGRMKVSPDDLLIEFDVEVRDGSIPGGNYSQVWEQMFQVLAQSPELQQEFDLVRIFKHIARNNGAKNVNEFVRVKTMPDEQVLQQQQQGNLIPMGDARNAIS